MKTVLVTGASSGIGKATARRLLDEGHTVYGAARRVEAMAELEADGGTALEMDITREADITAVVDRITDEAGGVDVLVNNAGYGLYGPVEHTSLDAARHQFEVNLFGAARLTQLVLPYMRGRRAGTIVNMSSMGGRISTPLGAWYHASKHALEGWSDCLRMELRRFGIRVVVIQPGIIVSEFLDPMLDPLHERAQGTAYQTLAESLDELTRQTYAPTRASPAAVVADAIARAIRARRPRTRYPVGRFARLLMTLRRWMPDRLWDWAMMRQYDAG